MNGPYDNATKDDMLNKIVEIESVSDQMVNFYTVIDLCEECISAIYGSVDESLRADVYLAFSRKLTELDIPFHTRVARREW